MGSFVDLNIMIHSSHPVMSIQIVIILINVPLYKMFSSVLVYKLKLYIKCNIKKKIFTIIVGFCFFLTEILYNTLNKFTAEMTNFAMGHVYFT